MEKNEMSSSIIDFSAQFGGRDAAAAVLPHFNALKTASHGIQLAGFPFPKLAYILRVDGEINQYGLSGAGNLELDSKGDYLSIEIGIKHEDRSRIDKLICEAILSGTEQIKDIGMGVISNVDFEALKICLLELIARYKNELAFH